MGTNSYRLCGASLILACCAATVTRAFAVDPACNQVNAAMLTLRTKPFHLYMTETRTYATADLAKAAGQIGLGGTKQSEEISTANSIYVMTGGKWIDMQTSFAAMEKDKDTASDTKKALDAAKCKALPDETMYGQAASVFLQSAGAPISTETKLWVSKSTHMPVRADVTRNDGTMKEVTVQRYDYNNVQAPANARTMKDLVKSGGR